MTATQRLDDAVKEIRKSYGAGSIRVLSDHSAAEPVEVISTGCSAINEITGIGGVPRGRIIEIYGPESGGKTTLALQIVREAQLLKGIAAYIDVEQALDIDYARKLGVDVDNLLMSQPDNGEEALEIALTLIKSGAVHVIVVDSVAALVPKSELEGDMGDPQMGLQARLMSQALRKLVAAVKQSGTVLIFINQVRDKIGVMFGCFHYNTRVVLADGTTEKIGKIVNQRLPVEVLSVSSDGSIEPRPVIAYHNNGKTKSFLAFEIETDEGSGKRKFSVTENHLIRMPAGGDKAASELKVGDYVLDVRQSYILSNSQTSLLVGSALGDGSLRGTAVRFGHGLKQSAYLKWKYQSLKSVVNSLEYGKKSIGFDTKSLRQEWFKFSPFGKKKRHRKLDSRFLDMLDTRAIAVWYQDDGTFSGSFEKWGKGKAEIACKSFSNFQKLQVADKLVYLGFPRPTITNNGFLFSGQRCAAFQEKIAPFVHPSMKYKIHPRISIGQRCFVDDSAYPSLILCPAKILKKYQKPQTRGMNRFDLTVDINHNYLADHIVVHNSPETTTGGRALKFYASLRIDIRRIGQLKKGDTVYGANTKIKIVKNKLSAPFRDCETPLIYGQGFINPQEKK